jgi:hypothetical protein
MTRISLWRGTSVGYAGREMDIWGRVLSGSMMGSWARLRGEVGKTRVTREFGLADETLRALVASPGKIPCVGLRAGLDRPEAQLWFTKAVIL